GPEVRAVGAAALGADQHAVVGIDDLEARGTVGRLHRGADTEARQVELACDLGVAGVERRVQERDVARVDAARHRLEPVALLDPLGREAVRVRQQGPLEMWYRRRRARRSHVRPDHAARFLAWIADVADLRREAGSGRLVRHLQTTAVHPELPAVVHAAHAGFLDPAEVERGESVRTELADEPGPAALRAERDEPLAQKLHALHPAPGNKLAREHDGDPVLPDKRAHRRARTRARQQLVVFPAQHWFSFSGIGAFSSAGGRATYPRGRIKTPP